MGKTIKIILFALTLILVFCSSAFASSSTNVYLKYDGSTFSVASYANTSGGSTFDEIEIDNQIQSNDITVVNNTKICNNTSSCQTNEITTYHSYSNDYASYSAHYLFNDDVLAGMSFNSDNL